MYISCNYEEYSHAQRACTSILSQGTLNVPAWDRTTSARTKLIYTCINIYIPGVPKNVYAFQEMLSMYYLPKLNSITLAMCSRKFTSPCDLQDSQTRHFIALNFFYYSYEVYFSYTLFINIKCVTLPFSNQNISLKPLFVRTKINLTYVKLYFMRESISNYWWVIWKYILPRERDCKIFYITYHNCIQGNPFYSYIWTHLF
jgi:hypothetical protein